MPLIFILQLTCGLVLLRSESSDPLCSSTWGLLSFLGGLADHLGETKVEWILMELCRKLLEAILLEWKKGEIQLSNAQFSHLEDLCPTHQQSILRFYRHPAVKVPQRLGYVSLCGCKNAKVGTKASAADCCVSILLNFWECTKSKPVK